MARPVLLPLALALAAATSPGRAAPPAPAQDSRALFVAAARTALPGAPPARLAAGPAGAGADLGDPEVAALHDPGEGPVVVAFRRPVRGVEVLGERAAVVLDRGGRPVATLGALSALRPAAGEAFVLPAAEAAARALSAATGAPVAARELAAGEGRGPWQPLSVRPAAAVGRPVLAGATLRARRLWRPVGGALRAAWAVEVDAPGLGGAEARGWAVLLSAGDGAVEALHPLARHEAFSYRVWAEDAPPYRPFDGPTGFAGTPHPTGLPDGFQPEPLAQRLVTLAHASTTTADPWLPPGATETLGNNADVYADRDAADGYGPPTDVRGRVSAPGAFDWTADLSLQPDGVEANQQAGLAHAFYVLNFLHDWFYDAGFDEAAHNMQASNYGRGGLEDDRFVAEVQDAGHFNNAVVSTRAEGGSPIMQVAVYTGITSRYVAWVAPAGPSRGRPPLEEATSSAFGQRVFDLPGALVAVDDGVAPAGDGCDDGTWATQDLTGRIALLDEAGCLAAGAACTCSAKARRAQDRGAAGVLVARDGPGYLFLSTAPADAAVTVPVLGLTRATADAFRAALGEGPVTVRLHRSAAVPRRDGAVDTLLLAHEWGHALAARLVGDNLGLFTHQAEALAEGWADFVALLLAVREEDATAVAGPPFGGLYAASSWTLGGAEGLFGGPNNAWYFGTRRVPYTTDLTRNALTFRHIQAGEPMPLATPGGAPIPFAENGNGADEAHNAGEVWATMLWECYAALLRDTVGPAPRLGFREAQDRMKRYLVASLQATPLSPTFLQARDALLATAMAGDPADGARFWQAFARRGAGEGALGPALDSPDNRPVLESFVSPFPEPPPPAAGSPGGGGGCQSGPAGALALAGVALLVFLRPALRRRGSRAEPAGSESRAVRSPRT